MNDKMTNSMKPMILIEGNIADLLDLSDALDLASRDSKILAEDGFIMGIDIDWLMELSNQIANTAQALNDQYNKGEGK